MRSDTAVQTNGRSLFEGCTAGIVFLAPSAESLTVRWSGLIKPRTQTVHILNVLWSQKLTYFKKDIAGLQLFRLAGNANDLIMILSAKFYFVTFQYSGFCVLAYLQVNGPHVPYHPNRLFCSKNVGSLLVPRVFRSTMGGGIPFSYGINSQPILGTLSLSLRLDLKPFFLTKPMFRTCRNRFTVHQV